MCPLFKHCALIFNELVCSSPFSADEIEPKKGRSIIGFQLFLLVVSFVSGFFG